MSSSEFDVSANGEWILFANTLAVPVTEITLIQVIEGEKGQCYLEFHLIHSNRKVAVFASKEVALLTLQRITTKFPIKYSEI